MTAPDSVDTGSGRKGQARRRIGQAEVELILLLRLRDGLSFARIGQIMGRDKRAVSRVCGKIFERWQGGRPLGFLGISSILERFDPHDLQGKKDVTR